MSRSIKKITLLLLALRLLRILLSVITLTVSADYFGISYKRDLWVLVSTFLSTLSLAIWGPVNETFRTKFIFIKEEKGEKEAVKQTGALIGFVLVVTLMLSLFIALFSGYLANYMIALPTSTKVSLFIYLLLLLLPSFLLNELTTLTISVLNAYNVYYIPEIVGTVTGVIGLFVIAFLSPSLGIYSLVIAQYVGGIFLFGVILYYLKSLRIPLWNHIRAVRWNRISGFIYFSLPFFFPYFVGQINALTEKFLAGRLGEGCISSLDYAHQFTSVLQGVLGSVLLTIMVPMLSKSFSQKRLDEYATVFREYLSVCFVVLCVVIPLLLGAAQPICQFFFLRGGVTPEDLSHIILISRLYAFSFIGIVLYMLFGSAALSMGKNKVYAMYGVAAQLFMLVLNLSLYNKVGIYIFPVSNGIAHFVAMIMIGRNVSVGSRDVCLKISRYVLVIVVISGVIYGFNALLEPANALLAILFNLLLTIVLLPIALLGAGFDMSFYWKKLLKKRWLYNE